MNVLSNVSLLTNSRHRRVFCSSIKRMINEGIRSCIPDGRALHKLIMLTISHLVY